MTPPEEPLLKPCPCPFCGKPPMENMQRTTCGCLESHGMFFIKDWNNAYCWKVLAEKDAAIERLKEMANFLTKKDLALDKLHFDWREKINRQEAEISALREAIQRFAQYGSDYEKQIQQQAEVIRIAREHLEKIAEASISHRLMPFAAQQALDKMNRGEGK